MRELRAQMACPVLSVPHPSNAAYDDAQDQVDGISGICHTKIDVRSTRRERGWAWAGRRRDAGESAFMSAQKKLSILMNGE